MEWYRAACPVCRADLHDDIKDKGWVTCFTCARSFGPNDVRLRDLTRVEIVEVEGLPAKARLATAA